MQRKKLTIVNFPNRFRDLVENSGYSQKDLAMVLGISEGSIVNYKRDRIPKAEELLAISDHFGVSIQWLLTGQGDNPPPAARSQEPAGLKQAKAAAERLAQQLGEAEETARALRGFLGL